MYQVLTVLIAMAFSQVSKIPVNSPKSFLGFLMQWDPRSLELAPLEVQ